MNHAHLSSGIGVWFEQEMENVIKAVDEANRDVTNAIPTREIELYRRGYRAAVNAIAAGFGLNYRSEDEDLERFDDFLRRHPAP